MCRGQPPKGRFLDAFAELACYTEAQDRLAEAGMAKDLDAIEEELDNFSFPEDEILVSPWRPLVMANLSMTTKSQASGSALSRSATQNLGSLDDVAEAIIANPYAATQARNARTADPLLPDPSKPEHSFDADTAELLAWEFPQTNPVAEQWRTELLLGGVQEAHARKDYTQLARAARKVETFARDPEAEIEKMMGQMPVYKLAKTEELRLVALAEAAKAAVEKAEKNKKEGKEEDAEVTRERENLVQQVASASSLIDPEVPAFDIEVLLREAAKTL
jgi:hypothetical protein